MAIQKILVPTDLSSEGERGVPEVSKLAHATGASVVLLHVVEDVGVVRGKEGKPASQGIPGTRQELERVRKALEERRKAFPGEVEVVVDAIAAPSVPHAILEYAREHGCDVIAVSTHGRSGFRRLIVGSVAEAIVRRSHVPVLVFPRES